MATTHYKWAKTSGFISTLGVLLHVVVLSAALIVLYIHWSAVQGPLVVQYQLVFGGFIAVFGGGVVGWGIATFVGSSDNTQAVGPKPNSDSGIAAIASAAAPGGTLSAADAGAVKRTDESPSPDSFPESSSEDEIPSPTLESLLAGKARPEQLKKAAEMGFKDVKDVLNASWSKRRHLMIVLGIPLFALVLQILGKSSKEKSEESKKNEPAPSAGSET